MILFTLLCLIVWRIGIHIKFPFANYDSIPSTGGGNIFGFLDVFAGGGLTQFSILSLGISPYITASIVVQRIRRKPPRPQKGNSSPTGRCSSTSRPKASKW